MQAFLSGADDFANAVNQKETRADAARAEALTQDEVIAQALAATRSEVQQSLAAADEAAALEVQRVAQTQAQKEAAEKKRQADIEAARVARIQAEAEEAKKAAQAKIAQREKEAKVCAVSRWVLLLLLMHPSVLQVIECLQECLGGNAMAFGEFKTLSGQYRYGRIDAKAYYIGVERLVGIDNSERLMPLLCDALPLEEKRVEFAAIIAKAEQIRAKRRLAEEAEAKRRKEAAEAARAAEAAKAAEDARSAAAQAESAAAPSPANSAAEPTLSAEELVQIEARRREAEALVAARDQALKEARLKEEARQKAVEEAAAKKKAREELVLEHKIRLRRFYAIEDPDKVDSVDSIFAKHGPSVWGKLLKKYGGTTVYDVTEGMQGLKLPPRPTPEQIAQEKAEAEAAAKARAEAEAKAKAEAEAKAKADAEARVRAEAEAAAQRAKAAEAAAAAAAAPVVVAPPADARVVAPSDVAGGAATSDAEHKARLRQFYSKVNPSKVEEVDKIYAKHGDRVWSKLVRKYGDAVYEATEGIHAPGLAPKGASEASTVTAAAVPPPPPPQAKPVDPALAEMLGAERKEDKVVTKTADNQSHVDVAEVEYLGGKLSITMWGAQEVMDPDTRKMFVEYVLKCTWSAGPVNVCS